MPKHKKKITEVLMSCPKCKWICPVVDCDCDADYPAVEDGGRLRCPRCGSVVQKIGSE